MIERDIRAGKPSLNRSPVGGEPFLLVRRDPDFPIGLAGYDGPRSLRFFGSPAGPTPWATARDTRGSSPTTGLCPKFGRRYSALAMRIPT